MKFDSSMHLHVGYYENGMDVEAIGYTIQDKDTWVFFFESNQELPFPYEWFHTFGYKIFTINADNISYEIGCKRFEEWLKENNMIECT
ncbi:DUF3986 family protein [Priestia taiwanensis]|uniref:DUF3986 domain-containing protein n=1 Tax=Priestia taiwanensis TaxID=1347902 RepID=A0A917ASJ5_9BACI|nr:DUF3986 family protein [Priestia taiwanensis]MBM7364222.1 hypothetical protein [Priestia taiwanensis]GGE72649.1 hypothetical protein GCM10007140_23200 [Priestia taiwanensis]